MSHLAGFGGTQGAGGRPALLVIDMSLGFTDRDPAAHEQALSDIDAKYGDVLPVARAPASLRARSGAEVGP